MPWRGEWEWEWEWGGWVWGRSMTTTSQSENSGEGNERKLALVTEGASPPGQARTEGRTIDNDALPVNTWAGCAH